MFNNIFFLSLIDLLEIRMLFLEYFSIFCVFSFELFLFFFGGGRFSFVSFIMFFREELLLYSYLLDMILKHYFVLGMFVFNIFFI